jgi:hypothetical protein
MRLDSPRPVNRAAHVAARAQDQHARSDATQVKMCVQAIASRTPTSPETNYSTSNIWIQLARMSIFIIILMNVDGKSEVEWTIF